MNLAILDAPYKWYHATFVFMQHYYALSLLLVDKDILVILNSDEGQSASCTVNTSYFVGNSFWPRSKHSLSYVLLVSRLPWGLSDKESSCQCGRCGRCGFNPWVRKIPLEKEMTTHSRILAWEIPWTEEPGGLHSMGLQDSLTQDSN